MLTNKMFLISSWRKETANESSCEAAEGVKEGEVYQWVSDDRSKSILLELNMPSDQPSTVLSKGNYS